MPWLCCARLLGVGAAPVVHAGAFPEAEYAAHFPRHIWGPVGRRHLKYGRHLRQRNQRYLRRNEHSAAPDSVIAGSRRDRKSRLGRWSDREVEFRACEYSGGSVGQTWR
jgi:hypothetical protein